MNIGIDASRANRYEKTGVEWYSFYLLKELYKLDSTNQFFLYTDKKLRDDLLPLPANFKEKVLHWPLDRFWTIGRMSMQMAFKKPDVLFVPAHTFPLIGAKKNVITWHDVGYERYPETYTKWELASLKQGAKRAINMADEIITISQYTKSEMVKLYDIDLEKIKVIYSGCNLKRWGRQDPEKVRQFLAKRNFTKPYFIFLGRITARKNIIGLIRIYNRFRQKTNRPFNLILVGNESGSQEEINKEIQLSPYKNEIIKAGWLPSVDLPLLLSGSQALIFPSFYEGFGLPVIEAMSCGVPVIASNSGSIPEIAGDAAILINAHEVDQFAGKMEEIISNNQLRQDLIAKGLKRVPQFSWENCAAQVLDVLTK